MNAQQTVCVAIIVLIALSHPVKAQDRPNPEDYDIATCKTLEDVNKAKAAGREFINLNGSYMFKYGDEYKGLYPSLRRAIDERTKLGVPSSGGEEERVYRGKTYFNPLSIIYPFTVLGEDKKSMRFEVPDGEVVDSSKVMLHVEPYSFANISFGLVNMRQHGFHFAVTGEFHAEDVVKEATGHLEYSVGTAVVSKEGDVLWKQYGIVDQNQGFRSIKKVESPPSPPEYLLVFLLAKGKLNKQLSRFEDAPQLDAKPYVYHVLSSSALEIADNWYPPIDDITKEEYLKLYKQEQQKRGSSLHPNLPPR